MPHQAVLVAASAAAMLAAAPAAGHRLDQYLQAIRVDIGIERILVEVDLTPGASLGAGVLSALDSNGDKTIAAAEEHAYVTEFLESLEVAIDGRRRAVSTVSARFPPSGDLLDGAGVIRLVLSADAGAARGAHRLEVRNRYRPDVGVYLANALRPAAAAITIAAQTRDPTQQRLEIDYMVGTRILAPASALWSIAATILLGFCLCWRRLSGRER